MCNCDKFKFEIRYAGQDSDSVEKYGDLTKELYLAGLRDHKVLKFGEIARIVGELLADIATENNLESFGSYFQADEKEPICGIKAVGGDEGAEKTIFHVTIEGPVHDEYFEDTFAEALQDY